MSTPRDKIEAKLGLTGPPLQSVRDSPPAIPDHELIRRIGQGAYGEVWLARNALGTWRAVKIVYRDNFKDARPYEREFAGIRRFEPLSRSNEGFVDILQVGRDDPGGWFYYVMELADAAEPHLKGEDGRSKMEDGIGASDVQRHYPSSIFNPRDYQSRTLARDLHHRGRLPLEDCLQLGLTLTLALGHLHRHGLIHRDIKPSNIIFVGGVPKLADIGLVTEAQGANTFVGTEGFVPPEGPTSPQADLYAMGKVLYEAAMGKDRHEFPEPFTQIGTDRESVALMELNAVLLRACAPDPKKRYATAEEMHADLALLHSGGSVKRRHQFDRQFQIAKQVGAVAIAATLLIGGAWLWQRQQTQKMTRLAEEKTTLATEKSKLADNLARLGEENRNRIVRLDIANGVRLLDEGDPAGALLWFADALPLLTNNPAEESVHRIRIQQTLDQLPRLFQVFPHESSVYSAAFSPDGRFVATGTRDGQVRVWNATDGSLVWGPKAMGANAVFLRFSRNGNRLFASSSLEQWAFNGSIGSRNFYAVLDANSGREVLSSQPTDPAPSTNLICAHFSPDDRWLVTAQKDNCIRVFDLVDGRLVKELRGHTDEVRFLSFNVDGSLLASASLDRTVRLWRLPSGEPVGTPLEHHFPVVRALLTGDGQHLITGSFENPGGFGNASSQAGEGEIQAWDTTTGQRLGEPIRKRDWLLMYLNPADTGQFYGNDSAYQIGSSVEPLFKIKVGAVQSWAFTKDSRWLAVGEAEKAARVIDTTTGELVAGPFPHGGEVAAIQFSPDQKLLLTASSDGNARVWHLRMKLKASARRTLPAPMQHIDPVTLGFQVGRAAGLTPILMEDEHDPWLFDDQLQPILQLKSSYPGMKFQNIRSAWQSNLWIGRRFEPDSKALVLFRPVGKDPRDVLLEHPDEIITYVITRDDRSIITSSRDGIIRYWRTSDGGLDKSFAIREADRGSVHGICPDGLTALWALQNLAEQPIFRVVDLETGDFVGDPHALPKGTMLGIRYAPDGTQFAFWDYMGAVTVLESRTGRVISSSIQHSGNLQWIEWDPGCARLLTAGHNDEVLVWDIKSGSQLFGPLRTPGGANRLARWSPDGRFIVSRNNYQQVRVWDAGTGEAVTPLLVHSGDIAFAFLTQSNRLIAASYPDQLQAWDLVETTLEPDALAAYAKLLSSRRLGASGATLTLKPEELGALNRSLRQRTPGLFE